MRWIILLTLLASLSACMTLSGNYRLEAYDAEGNLLDDSISMMAEGSGIYTARNAMCSVFPGALIRITDINTGEELSQESPYQCRGQFQQIQKNTLDVHERWDFEFDQRSWVLGNKDASKTQAAREYILAGEDIKNWSELVTSYYGVIEPSSRAYTQIQQMGGIGPYMVAFLKHQFTETCQSPHVDVIESSPGDTLFEWRHQGCAEYPAQHQIQRIIATDSGMSTLSYVKKTHRLNDAERKKWIKLLRSASYKDHQ